MNALRRGVRNAFRNPTRTVAVVLIVSVILALAISMFVARQASGENVQSVSSNLGTSVLVSPAGTFGGFGGGNPLTATDISKITTTKNVISVVSSVSARLSSPGDTSTGFFNRGAAGSTSVTSPLTIGSIGQHQGGFGGGGGSGSGFGGGGSGFQPPNPDTPLPVTVLGVTTPLDPTLYGANSVKLTTGAAINGSSSALDADVGSTLASKNKLTVGSTFTAFGKKVTVVGIFTTNETTANAQFILPLKTEESLSDIDGVTAVYATVNSLGNVQSTASAIKGELGSSVADVTTAASDSSQAASQLSSIKTIATFSLVGAIVAAIAILLMSMLMIVRERRREIGILKAFGSSNGGVVSSFIAEALTITVLSAIIGTAAGLVLSSPILNALVSGTKNSGASSGGFHGGGPISFRSSSFGFGGNTLSKLHTVFGADLIVYCVLIVVAIALVGSAVPAYVIAKVRPAEVLRSE